MLISSATIECLRSSSFGRLCFATPNHGAQRDVPNALKAIKDNLELARRVNAKTREAELLWRAAQTYYAMHDYNESTVSAEKALMLARSLQLPKLIYLATAALGEAYAADDKV